MLVLRRLPKSPRMHCHFVFEMTLHLFYSIYWNYSNSFSPNIVITARRVIGFGLNFEPRSNWVKTLRDHKGQQLIQSRSPISWKVKWDQKQRWILKYFKHGIAVKLFFFWIWCLLLIPFAWNKTNFNSNIHSKYCWNTTDSAILWNGKMMIIGQCHFIQSWECTVSAFNLDHSLNHLVSPRLHTNAHGLRCW
jgi:hypothetical protein